jgi:Kdo2-lipid IVA lauroyltransferase/acyltransferase
VRRERRFALEAGLARLVGAVVSCLPRRLMLAMGRGLGRAWAAIDRRHVAIAADNLRRAFPEWDEARVGRTARAVYAHFGQVLLDILWLEARSREQVEALIDVEGGEHPRAAVAEGRGVLFATCHIGNWELQGIATGWMLGGMGVVGRPLDNPALDARLSAFRTRGGNIVISKHRALPQILRLLRERRGVAFLVDQNVQESDGIFVEFFGRPAATTTAVAAFAVKTGCPVVAGYSLLGPDGRYRLVYTPRLEWTPSGDRAADVARLTQELTRLIESWVRAAPEQWLWVHRRWKTQPRPASPPDPPAPGS